MKVSITKKEYIIIDVENDSKLHIIFTNHGAAIKDIYYENKLMTLRPIDDAIYYDSRYFYGKTVGRSAGRIKNATYTLNHRTAFLEKNNFGVDNLHGGINGLHSKDFNYSIQENKDYLDVVFTYASPDLEGGYLYSCDITITYRVYRIVNMIDIIYDATSDTLNFLNLTNHTYFNLSGNLRKNILSDKLYINASKIGLLSDILIIQKKIDVDEVMDFRKPKEIGKHMHNEILQKKTKGYDHQYFLDEVGIDKLAAKLEGEAVNLEVYTTYPCIVFYSGNHPLDSEVYKGVKDSNHLALCLECQFHPDGIHQEKENYGLFDHNHPYHEITRYQFISKE